MRWSSIVLAFACLSAATLVLAEPRTEPYLDPNFGRAGVVALRAPLPRSPGTYRPSGFAGVTDSSGRTFMLSGGEFGSVLTAYDPDGRLERTFGGAGVVALGALGDMRRLILDSAGRLIVVGAPHPAPDDANTSESTVVARVLPDGRLDPGFGSGGVYFDRVLSAHGIYSDGFGGVFVLATSRADPRLWVVFRLGADGEPDRSYGENGVAPVPRVGTAFNLGPRAVDATGRFVALDLRFETPGPPDRQRALVGLDAFGRPDAALGADGTRFLDLGEIDTGVNARLDDARSMGVDSMGRYVVLFSHSPGGSRTAGYIARLLPDGTPDANWSGAADGVRQIAVDGDDDRQNEMWTLTLDGTTVYAAGTRFTPGKANPRAGVVVRMDDETAQVWIAPSRRFPTGHVEVISARENRVLGLSETRGRLRPGRRLRSGLVRLIFD
ncbi:MAG: hypothetical protein HMLKMBBP_03298 [Planctomycetes bacterium]|nr:hypothetical protein [Planctomycetota bacterium]